MDLPAGIDKTWTLFLDRDGVINHEKKMDYILNWNEFTFYHGVTNALQLLASCFGIIVMVTNQRGVGKKLMTETDLENIHTNMLSVIAAEGGRIDKIYYCTSMDNDCFERKPNHGMALLAQNDFPSIDFKKSIIIGNKLSDMQFGRNAGMYTCLVVTTNPEIADPHPLVDFRQNDLYEAAIHLTALTES